MDKRWALIIIILVVGVGSMYYIVDNSNTVGSAIATFSKTTITIPDGFAVSGSESYSVELYNKKNTEKIEILDFEKRRDIKNILGNMSAAFQEQDDYDNITNKTVKINKVTVYQSMLKSDNDTLIISCFYKDHRAYCILMNGYESMKKVNEDLDFIIETMHPDYKQSQD